MGQAETHRSAQEALKSLMGTYKTYKLDIIRGAATATNKTAKEEAAAVKSEAERLKIGRGGGYVEGIIYKPSPTVTATKFTDIEAVIYNKKKPQIVHLLEYGHDVVDSRGKVVGHAKAYPHFKPNEEKFNDIYVQRIVEAIEKAGG